MDTEEQEQLPDNISPKELTTDTIQTLERSMRPSVKEFTSMIRSLCDRKHWTRGKLAAILSTPQGEIAKIENGVGEPSGALLRLVWMLWTLDTNPELAMSITHIATWGRTAITLPSTTRSKLKGEDRKKAIEWILNWKNDPEYRGQKLTYKAIQGKFGITYPSACTLCRDAGYKPSDCRSKSFRTPKRAPILDPNRIWLNLDWRKSDETIAAQIGVSPFAVARNRREFRKIMPAILRKHLLACGMENFEERFKPIFKNHLRRKKHRTVRESPNPLESRI